MGTLNKRLVLASNRLPIVIKEEENSLKITPGAGGLVTAISPVMKKNHGIWIGWPGCDSNNAINEPIRKYSEENSYELKPVFLSPDDVNKYYHGFSNETIWPLFHDLLGYCKFSLENWGKYYEVNRSFAEIIAQSIQKDDFVWIHDYQLMMVGHHLKKMNIQHPLAYFLHIPFPSLDLFRRIPWKHEIIKGLMEYELIGFQTLRDRRNFVSCVRGLIPDVTVTVKNRYSLIKYGERTVKVAHFPISIDFYEFNNTASSKEVAESAWYIHENYKCKQLIFGIDRLDYTKGIPERFLAFERALEKYPDLHSNISLIQVIVPSRTRVPDYQDLKKILDELIGRINGKFSRQGWTPIHYIYRSLDRIQLLGFYRACEIAFITPLRDGMNLVAKEYCASSIDNNGVLILSEFAGVAEQLRKGAIIINPYDLEGTADAIYKASKMDTEERKRRMNELRSEIKRNDVHRWVEWFMGSFQDMGTEAT